MNPTPWIIDCDPGCDDAIALALAAFELEGTHVEIHTVAGNVAVELTTWNACRLVRTLGKSWPVYRGCRRSLSGEAVPAASVHGRDGLGDIPIGAMPCDEVAKLPSPKQESAVTQLLTYAEPDKPFVLVCTGPLTNLASALNLLSAEKQGVFWNNCQYFVVMGGAFETPGNITAAAEFNTHFDPVALHLVLESWRECHEDPTCPRCIHFVPLDVTELIAVPLPDEETIEKKHKKTRDSGEMVPASSPGAEFLRATLRKYGLFHARYCRRPRGKKQSPLYGVEDFIEEKYLDARAQGKSGLKDLHPFCYLHDPLAVWVALELTKKKPPAIWLEAFISVDIEPGPNRGRILIHRERLKLDNPSRLPTLGTKVNWLAPIKFNQRRRNQFVSEIKKLLGLPKM